MMTASLPKILTIAGSDSGGGAGIQADIKTITVLGGYAMTAITAITAQNTLGVHGIHMIPPDMIEQQIRVVLSDIGADIIKIGMLGDASTIQAVHRALSSHETHIPLILDPVMQAKGGQPLLQDDAIQALKNLLFPHATLITPNIPEAAILSEQSIDSVDDMKHVAKLLSEQCKVAVLVKGGHGSNQTLHNVLYDGQAFHTSTSQRHHTKHTHGTGCTMASAIATYVGHGLTLYEAIHRATKYVHEAITHAPGYGQGHGAIHHGWPWMIK